MIKAINLKCENLINPIGIDVQNPRLSWTCEGGIKQTAYRIVAESNGKTIWDSGKVQSNLMFSFFSIRTKRRLEKLPFAAIDCSKYARQHN